MKQPESLRLADALSHLYNTTDINELDDAATELRRLHEANQAMLEALKALEELGAFEDGMFGDHGEIPQAQAKSRAAIAKGEQS